MILIMRVGLYPVILWGKLKDGKLTRRDGIWHAVPLESGLGSSNIISMVTFFLESFQWGHHDGVEILQEEDMVIFCSKIVQLLPVIFIMGPSCLVLACKTPSLHNDNQ